MSDKYRFGVAKASHMSGPKTVANCENCGAQGHTKRNCLERPSKNLLAVLQPGLGRRQAMDSGPDVTAGKGALQLMEPKGKRSKISLAYEDKHDLYKNYVISKGP